MCQFLCCTLRGSYQVIDDGCVAVLYTVKTLYATKCR